MRRLRRLGMLLSLGRLAEWALRSDEEVYVKDNGWLRVDGAWPLTPGQLRLVEEVMGRNQSTDSRFGRLRHCVREVVRHPREGWLGAREFRLTVTSHFDDEDLLESYDSGRELAHLLTLRRFEP
jgi:hypothetical protein